IQPAAVSDEKFCIQLPTGGQIHHFLTEASVHAACLKDQVLSIHIRQWKDLRLFVHSHDDDNGAGPCNLPGHFKGSITTSHLEYSISSTSFCQLTDFFLYLILA